MWFVSEKSHHGKFFDQRKILVQSYEHPFFNLPLLNRVRVFAIFRFSFDRETWQRRKGVKSMSNLLKQQRFRAVGQTQAKWPWLKHWVSHHLSPVYEKHKSKLLETLQVWFIWKFVICCSLYPPFCRRSKLSRRFANKTGTEYHVKSLFDWFVFCCVSSFSTV